MSLRRGVVFHYHGPGADQTCCRARFLHVDGYVVPVTDCMFDAILQPVQSSAVESPAAGEIQVLAVAFGPVAKSQAGASLEHEMVQQSRFVHRIEDAVVQQLLLDGHDHAGAGLLLREAYRI